MTHSDLGQMTDRTHDPARKHPTARAAELLFAQCPYGSLRDLSCEYHEGLLILKGQVPSYYLKSIAQTVARGVAGVRQIENRLEVADGEVPPGEVPPGRAPSKREVAQVGAA
jgi:osmotically-inducible protein OsmY